MAKIKISDRTIECNVGDNLRQVLMKAGVKLYNGPMRAIHCRGLGTCGTCAVKLTGHASKPTTVERWRLNFPPHQDSLSKGIRLACQCQVEDDLTISKLDGWWGQKTNESTND